MMKILRITRHPADAAQIAALREIYGEDVAITDVAESVGVARVLELAAEHAADVLDVVLPVNLLAELLGPRGTTLPVIRAVMNRVPVSADGREVEFVFDHYERITRVVVETEVLA